MNAVIYAGYSSDSQREESIEGQIRECTAFAEKNDIILLRRFCNRMLWSFARFFTRMPILTGITPMSISLWRSTFGQTVNTRVIGPAYDKNAAPAKTVKHVKLKRAILIAAVAAITLGTVTTATAVNERLRKKVFEIFHIEIKPEEAPPLIDSEFTAEDMQSKNVDVHGKAVKGRHVYAPAGSHAGGDVFLVCTDEAEMRQESPPPRIRTPLSSCDSVYHYRNCCLYRIGHELPSILPAAPVHLSKFKPRDKGGIFKVTANSPSP